MCILVYYTRQDSLHCATPITLVSFLPGHQENSATGLLDAIGPLRRLTAAGLAVLLSHHPRKGEARAGQASRGSGALPAFADILLEMNYYNRADAEDLRRNLRGFSRFERTPRPPVLELSAGCTG